MITTFRSKAVKSFKMPYICHPKNYERTWGNIQNMFFSCLVHQRSFGNFWHFLILAAGVATAPSLFVARSHLYASYDTHSSPMSTNPPQILDKVRKTTGRHIRRSLSDNNLRHTLLTNIKRIILQKDKSHLSTWYTCSDAAYRIWWNATNLVFPIQHWGIFANINNVLFWKVFNPGRFNFGSAWVEKF